MESKEEAQAKDEKAEEIKPEPVIILEETSADPFEEIIVEKASKDYESLKFIPIVEKPVPVFFSPLKPINDEKSVLEKVSEQHRETSSVHQSISIQKDEKELLEKFLSAKIAILSRQTCLRSYCFNSVFSADW